MGHEGTGTKGTPAQSYIIKRPRLTKLLDESEARIILLVAPAGYGKTTLAREWLHGRAGVAWYSGRPATADVAALASGLVDALINDEAERDRAIERVQILAARGQPPDVLARTVASAMSASTSILVIDDCHCASSAESEALLNALTLETSLRVVLTSRTRPRWVTSRMVVYREATILEMSDLAFTNEEARAVIGQSGDEATLDLITKAHGWPAVIGLAVHHGTSDIDGHLPSSDLYEFFAEDLFRRAASDLQRGLILLALGGDTNTDVTRTVLGEDHEAILSAALDHGFLGQRTGQLEIHPLLRTFFLEQLDHLPPADAQDTVTLVVKVLAANGMWDECLSALQCYPIPALISSILSESLADLLASGRIDTVRRWVDLARSNHGNDPMLVLAEAEIALRDRDDPGAQILGARAATLLGAGDASARAYIVAARAAHFRDDLPAVKEYTDLAMSCTSNSDLHATALWTAFSNAAERSETEARAILDRLNAMSDDRPEHALRLLNAEALMLANRGGGSVRAVAEKTELARALLQHVRDPFLTTNALNVFAAVAVVLARYESALSLADEMVEEATSSGLDFALDHALLVRASALIGLRKLTAAQRTLNEIEDRSDRISTHIVGNLQLQRARLKIASGDLERASQLLECHPPEPLPEVYTSELLAHRGLVFAALGDAKRATDAFAEVQLYAAYAGSTCLCDLGKAVLGLRQGEAEERCVKVLLRIIDEGHLDAIVVAARAFPGLVRAGSTNDTSARALTQILASSSDVDLGRQAGLQMPRVLRRHGGLSPRERDVYELIVQGQSNKAIARTLFISESTTKVHVRHIFEKLGVHTRAEVARTSLENLR